jgi:hypothetical protein
VIKVLFTGWWIVICAIHRWIVFFRQIEWNYGNSILFSSALPRKIVGTLGTMKVLLPSYPVNKCILSQNKEDIDTFRQFYLVTEHKLPLLSNCWLFRVAAHYLLRASNDIFYWRDINLSPVPGTSQLFSEATPRKIVGTEGTIKLLLPEYQVYKCFIIHFFFKCTHENVLDLKSINKVD